MSGQDHRYRVSVEWTGNSGTGTSGYRAYERSHEITVPNSAKPSIPGSSDPNFRGDPARWNPEELLVASLSACHKLWYLHLCAEAGVIVTHYVDEAEGVMTEDASGASCFSQVVLRPAVTVRRGTELERARTLHERAHQLCFIANSVNFPVLHEPRIVEGDA